jgi:hypothetical protein
MSIVDDLIVNLVERNSVRVSGSLRIALVAGGVRINGTIASTLRDQNKNKDVLKTAAPVDASVRIGDLVIPVPRIP